MPRKGRPADLGQLAELLVAVGRARPLFPAQPVDGDVAVLVVQRRSAWISASNASGAAPPNWPLCFGPASVLASTVTIAMPRSAIVSVGTPGRTLPMSPITIASAANRSGRVGGKVREGAPDLLLALDHDLDPDRRLAVPGAQRADVHEDVRLRVRRAAPVDGAVALGRLERRRLPLRLVADRHDVVVAVQEDRRRARRRRDLADDDRRRVRELERARF